MPRRPDSSPQTLKVFAALLDDPAEWHHGYGLSKATGLASGTLYPILMRLAERGLLETRWDPPEVTGRPPRHACRLTADGADLARERIAEHSATSPARPNGVRRAMRPSTTPRTAS